MPFILRYLFSATIPVQSKWMFAKLGRALRPVVMWKYRRMSWQYDVICGLILAFIFLTPQEFFGDQPRPHSIREIQELSDDKGTVVFWVAASFVEEASEEDVDSRLERMLRQRSGKNLRVISKAPAPDPDGEVRAYLVYARP